MQHCKLTIFPIFFFKQQKKKKKTFSFRNNFKFTKELEKQFREFFCTLHPASHKEYQTMVYPSKLIN